MRQWNVFSLFPLSFLFFLLAPLTHLAFANETVTLTWDPNTEDNLAGYRIYVGTSPGSYDYYDKKVGNTTTYTCCSPDRQFQVGLVYYFTLTAYDFEGQESEPSNEVSIQIGATHPDTTPPTVPLNLQATPLSATEIRLTWSPATDDLGVTGYTVARNGLPITSVPTSTYTDQGLQPATTYDYTVRAEDAAGNRSPASAPRRADTLPLPDTMPPTITLLTPHAGDELSGPITLTGNALDDVGVIGVQFHLDGQPLGPQDPSSPYAVSWDTTSVADGSYTLTATARDAAGNTTTSAPRSVTVANTPALPPPDPSDGPLLFEDFSAGTFPGWNVVDDASGSSSWSAVSGTLTQTSNIYGGSTRRNGLPKPGTYAVYAAGLGWTDYQATFTLRSDDNDAVGVMFRYQDGANYYRFSWDKQRDYRRLVKVVNGTWTLLAEDSVPYVQAQTYYVTVKAQGSSLEVWIDGSLIFTVPDSSFSSGSVALYSWANKDSAFDDIQVNGLGGTAPPSDQMAPTVQLTAPAAGTAVTGSISLTATASDNVGVVGVQFHVNGQAIGVEDTTAGYAVIWDTTTVSDGSYTLTATARDAAGNSTSSAPRSVIVNNAPAPSPPPADKMAPTVQLTSPAAGTTVTGSITLTATASDNVGVEGVQFYVNGQPLGPEDPSSPYAFSWDTTTVADGSYSLTATARDAAGNTTSSAPVIVTVSNNAPPSSPGELVISTIIAASGRPYQLGPGGLTDGALQYIDRSDTFLGVPHSLKGFPYIQTANDDGSHNPGSTAFLSFTVNQPVTVYVAHGLNVQPKPAWLTSFTNAGHVFISGNVIFQLHKKAFPQGTVTLGSNQDTAQSANMYTVVIEPTNK